jgi:hypothetical protein
MKYDVVVEIARPELLAAVRATILLSDILRTWKPALDCVWTFLSKRSASRPLMRQRGWRRAVASSRVGVQRYVGPDDRRCGRARRRYSAAG